MNDWFADCTTWLPSHFVLNNNEPVLLRNEIDEVDVSTTILPVIIPFDEAGAIETLLLQAIEDSSDDGKRIAQSSREYIRQFEVAPLSQYLNKQRLRTKAKYSAAVAITKVIAALQKAESYIVHLKEQHRQHLLETTNSQ